jgi:hypothetical protein
MSDDDRIRFTCPHCKRRLRVAASAAGKRIRCPKCEKAVGVPEATEPEEIDLDYRGYVTYKAAREELVSRLKAVAGSVGLWRCKYENPAQGRFTYTYDPSCYGGRRLYELTFWVVPGEGPNRTRVQLELYDRTGVEVFGFDCEKGEHHAFLEKVHKVLGKAFPLAPPDEQLSAPRGCLVVLLSLGVGAAVALAVALA